MTATLYLAAVIAANMTVQAFGPAASVAVAFVMIGATLTLRDAIHDRHGPRAMLVLIPVGAAVSWGLGAGGVALASAAAFAASELVDTGVYHALRRHPWLARANGSNLAGAAVDSVVFPLLAFGGFLWPVMVAQFVAKVAGGAVWAWMLGRRRVAMGAAALALFTLAAPADAQDRRPPRFVVQAQAGTAHYPWRNYEPVPQVGINALVFLPRDLSILAVVSRDVERGTEWVGIVALQWRLLAW